jgi:hypothetical protein
LLGGSAERRPTDEIFARTYWWGETCVEPGGHRAKPCQMRLQDGNHSNLPGGISILIIKLIIGLFGLAFLAACETTTITPTASMKPALADRLAVLNTDEPMPPAEGPEDVAPGPARDPTRNPGLVPSPLLRYSAASMTP